MSELRNRFVALLKSQVGYHEGRDPNGNWNNHQRFSAETPGLEWSQDQAWCATFEAWAAHQLAMDSMWPMTASCSTAVAWWKNVGRFSDYPTLGGPLYMGPTGGDHTEVVISYTADTVTSVGGNTNNTGSYQGDGVYIHTRPRRGAGSPYGYGVPAWPEGTISADPKWGGTSSATVQTPSTQEADVLSDADIQRILNTKLGDQYAITVDGNKFVPTVSDALNGGAYATRNSQQARDLVAALTAKMDALTAKVTTGGGLSAAQTQAAAQAGAQAALSALAAALNPKGN